ncbi:MAG: hypothetical protein WBD31_06835 [Rubripirellula sp.]
MMHCILQIVVLSLLCGLCGCSKTPQPPLSDEQYLAKWRNAELDQDISHEGGTWHFDFQTVRLFRINWDDQYTMRHMLTDGELNDTRVPLDGITLTDAQVRQLEAAVTGTHTDVGIGLCIYPHHAFVFYDAEDQIVGTIDLCFLCNSFHAKPNGYARNWDVLFIAELIHDTGMPLRNPSWE